jgi:hypothetical protein
MLDGCFRRHMTPFPGEVFAFWIKAPREQGDYLCEPIQDVRRKDLDLLNYSNHP